MSELSALEKANELRSHLGSPSWLNFIGLGEENGKPCIYVYTNKSRIDCSLIPSTWYDMPVMRRNIGRIRPGKC